MSPYSRLKDVHKPYLYLLRSIPVEKRQQNHNSCYIISWKNNSSKYLILVIVLHSVPLHTGTVLAERCFCDVVIGYSYNCCSSATFVRSLSFVGMTGAIKTSNAQSLANLRLDNMACQGITELKLALALIWLVIVLVRGNKQYYNSKLMNHN